MAARAMRLLFTLALLALIAAAAGRRLAADDPPASKCALHEVEAVLLHAGRAAVVKSTCMCTHAPCYL